MAEDSVCIQEVTNKGDSFGFSLSEIGSSTAVKLAEATRYFVITLLAGKRSIGDIYAGLPKNGDTHPDIADCYVSDISCRVTEDVNIYQATVNYKWKNPEPVDPDIPWKQPAAVSFSSDSSITRAMDFAYLSLGTTANLIPEGGLTHAELIKLPILKGDGVSESVPIVNQPLQEPPMNLPEEPVKALAIKISTNIAGGAGLPINTAHDISKVLKLLDLVHTVYGDKSIDPTARLPFNAKGFLIDYFCGYISEVNVEALFYKSTIEDETYAYYKIDITILYTPLTWITKMLNLSYNTLSADDIHIIEAITVTDGKSKIRSKVDKPQEINPTSAEPRFINSDGTVRNTISGQSPNPSYLLYFLTKPLSNWADLAPFLEYS